jgi:indole-3-glycerol phosphate synthase
MILDRIVADTQRALQVRRNTIPLTEMQRMALAQSEPLDFDAALKPSERIRLIAEVKKASPSKGIIRSNFDPVEIAKTYSSNGAAAISVLTEADHFLGNLDYLKKIRDSLGNHRPPLLRKDFIFDAYQVYESRAFGADAILLITAILTPEKLRMLMDLSKSLGMNCLVEVHNEKELETALNNVAEIIGINNRDLQTFNVDLTTTKRLRRLIPPGKIVVSESGIKSHEDIQKLAQWGVNAVLIGEAFMSAPDIAAKMRELL